MIVGLLLVMSVVATLLLFFLLPRTAWFRRMRAHWLVFRLAWTVHKMKEVVDNYDSPKSKLKRAREAVEVLRAGFWVNPMGDNIYLDSGEYSGIAGRLSDIVEALEANSSYEQIGTTKEEVIGFRNGNAHKASARLQVDLFRNLKQEPRIHCITKLAEDAGFTLDEIGTSVRELESLQREHDRLLRVDEVQGFREWATGKSDFRRAPDEFEKRISDLLSGKHYAGRFTYEEIGTSEQEYLEIMRLARRREVIFWIDYFKNKTDKGETDNSFARKEIRKSLKKSGLALSDFGITALDLDEIERRAYINKAKDSLKELKTPGEGWFYSGPLNTNYSNVRFYKPALLGCIPGDPLVFVKEIEKNLATAKSTLSDIGTNESEMKVFVRAGHLASVKFLLKELEDVSQTPRRTRIERVASMLGPKAMIMDDPSSPIDRTTLEDPYPIDRDIQAIEYHLNGAGIGLEEIGSSQEKLQELKAIIEAR
ncbi:MAG: hypothetical protein G01um10143_386 [Parcubacteria group bacterium Gr01-1014_3]|nr:MAG: hypothetical protein G01um10143_386 [Parcubacteria group bacterium Gr01-1014_3]